MEASQDQVTALLVAHADGDGAAMDRLAPLVYGELHELARRHRYSWPRHASPGTTSLVHEAFLKLVDQTRVDWQSRRQFFYLASRAMRSILIDNARRYQRQKRGGGRAAVPLDDVELVSESRSAEVLAVGEALERLEAYDAELAHLVDCRVFGGLTVDEIAAATGVSPATVKRRWALARSWLYRAMSPAGDGSRPGSLGED